MIRRITVLLALVALLLAAGAPAFQTASIPLTALGAEPFEALQGPFDEVVLQFQVPPDWELQAGTVLALDLRTFFSSFVPAQGEISQENLVAGNLSVSVDGNLVQRDVLSQNGQVQLIVPLSPDVFDPNLHDHTLSIGWDASTSCDLNLSSTILIQPESSLTFEHITTAFNADLSQLPYPFFTNNALERPGTLIVLPAGASEAHVAAGLAAAAGLGRGSSDAITILTEDHLSATARATHHLIFVGPVSAFASLNGVSLPHTSDGRISQGGLGFVELVTSPFNDSLGLLVVSGGDDAALLNAARQVGSGALVLNDSRDLAVIEGDPQFAAPASAEIATFAQLGRADLTFERYGRSELTLPFYVSPDRPVSNNAYLDLRFAHSELIDYLRSGLSLSLNGQPLSTVRLSDQSALRHNEVVLLSPTSLHPGWNQISIAADVLPLDLCAGEQERQHWLTIYSDSTVNLPPDDTADASADAVTFGDLSPFFADQMRGSTIVLPSARAEVWTAAANLLRGFAANTWPLLPQVSFMENAGSASGNLIVVSRFEDYTPLPAAEAAFLQPGGGGSGQVTLSTGAQLSYQPGLDLGLLAVTSIQAEGGRALWALGTNAKTLGDATTLLTSSGFSGQNQNANLLLLQGGTLIRDEGSAAAIATPEVDPAAPIERAATGKGIYLYMILALLIFAVGLVLWEQLDKRSKG